MKTQKVNCSLELVVNKLIIALHEPKAFTQMNVITASNFGANKNYRYTLCDRGRFSTYLKSIYPQYFTKNENKKYCLSDKGVLRLLKIVTINGIDNVDHLKDKLNYLLQVNNKL